MASGHAYGVPRYNDVASIKDFALPSTSKFQIIIVILPNFLTPTLINVFFSLHRGVMEPFIDLKYDYIFHSHT